MFLEVSVCPRRWGTCMAGGVRGTHNPPLQQILRHTVNERAVRILLECIPVILDVLHIAHGENYNWSRKKTVQQSQEKFSSFKIKSKIRLHQNLR